MKSQSLSVHRFTVALLLALVLVTSSALAGPPLICHSFDIGGAKSLPWIGHDWNLSGTESYDTKNLAADRHPDQQKEPSRPRRNSEGQDRRRRYQATGTRWMPARRCATKPQAKETPE